MKALISLLFILSINSFASSFLTNLFGTSSIECNSKEALNLTEKIIKEKLFNKTSILQNYKVDNTILKTIITTNVNNDTGARECKAIIDVLGYFNLNQKSNKDFVKTFDILFGADNALKLDDNYYLITMPISFTIELTTDKKEYYIQLKATGKAGKYLLYAKPPTITNNEYFNLLFPFAEKGNPVAQNKIGILYENGNVGQKDINKAFNWYKKAADQEYHWAQYNLANLYYNNKDYKNAFEYFLKSSNLNNYSAMNSLGNMYFHGRYVKKDSKKAIEYYKKAANGNDAMGAGNLGYLYHYGYEIQQDYEKALLYYEIAADQENITAIRNIGYIYNNEKYKKHDSTKALAYFKLSAQKGDKDAQYMLGSMYVLGKGTSVDMDEGNKWLTLSAKQGNENAKKALGMINKKETK